MSNSQKSNSAFTQDDVQNMRAAVGDLIDGLPLIYNQYNNEATVNSLAFKEQNSFANKELIRDVHSRGMLSMESAADHLMVFADSIAEPAKTIAPWTCVRGLLESCAIGAWFLDPAIDARTRLGRCFAFRYLGFTQQSKFFQAVNEQSGIDHAQKRIKKVEQDAVSLGYARLLNKNGDINGIAQPMPSITVLIGTTLGREAEYRLLSGIAHGHHWAIQQIGFRVVEVTNAQGESEKALEKVLHPGSILYVANIAVTSLSRVLWYLWQLYGWDLKQIEDLLNTTYDRLGYRESLRFWI
jgi:hypothetical protein